MPKKPPRLPDADDLPEIEADDSVDASLPVDTEDSERHDAGIEVSESLEEISIQSFENAPHGGPLDFDDGTNMGRH